MSENQESSETLLPDDADRKIEELMAALRESEQAMMGVTADKDEAEEPAAEEVAEPEPEEEPLGEDDSDFVDLDALQLDNSADKLELDESDASEEQLMDELAADAEEESEQEFETENEFEQGLDSIIDEQQALEADELARSRLDELEQKLAAVEAAPMKVPAPVRSSDSFPGWISASLAIVAVALSSTALWFNNDAPAPQPPAPTISNEADMGLQSLKVDMAALRERLSAVETQAEQGGEEAVVMLERMQTMLARMEAKILSRTTGSETKAKPVVKAPAPVVPVAPVKQEAAAVVAKTEVMASVDITEAVVNKPKPVNQPSQVPTKEGKVFVKGWSVNLRSFYHRVDAERMLQQYKKAGIDAQVRETPKGDATWHRVRVMGFKSKKDAWAFINTLTVEQGRDTAWPSRYKGYVDG